MWNFFQGALVALLAPTGIWFGWFLQRREKAEDRRHARKDLLREKAERIYLEIEAAQDRSVAYVFRCLADSHGKLTDGESLGPAPNIHRLTALLHMYFPGADDLISNYDIANFNPIQKHSARFQEITDDPAVDTSEKLKRVKESQVECAKETNTTMIEFLGAMRVFMNVEVRKLL
jgi:hypothetical protein